MNPQETQSTFSSLLLSVLMIAGGSLVTKGIASQDQANALATELSGALPIVVGLGVAWWKKNQHSPVAVAAAVASTPAVASAVIDTVNTDAVPGVKVVADTSVSPAVSMHPVTGKIVPAHERS